MINKKLEKVFAWLNTITVADFALIFAHLRGEMAISSLPPLLELCSIFMNLCMKVNTLNIQVSNYVPRDFMALSLLERT